MPRLRPLALRRHAASALLGASGLLAALPPLAAQSAPSPVAEARGGVTVTVVLSGLQPRGGLIGAALFASPEGFPKQHAKALRRERQPDRTAMDSLVFRDVPPGRYAIAVHHDVDANGELAENAMGIPREPWAVSRNLRPRFSAPKFDAAAIDVRGDTRIEVVVK